MMVTRAADYALRALLALAGQPPGARVCLAEMAEACEIPPAFLYKVFRSLTRRGLLAPHRGAAGGYELTPHGRQASVLDVVEAVDGLPLLNACVLSGGCHRATSCALHPVWVLAQDRMREVLAGTCVADLAAEAGHHQAAGSDRQHDTPSESDTGRPARAHRRRPGTHRTRMGHR